MSFRNVAQIQDSRLERLQTIYYSGEERVEIQSKMYSATNLKMSLFSFTFCLFWTEINRRDVGELLYWIHCWSVIARAGGQRRYLLRRLNIRPDSKQKPNRALNDTT